MIRYDFAGSVALVTGGTSGIGRATALAFARAGAQVAVCARSEQAAASTCAAIEALSGRALFVQVDVRDEASVSAMVERVASAFGRLDYAIHAAGVGGDMAPLEHTNQSVWDDVMATNARGVWLCMRHEMPALLRAGSGAIVNVCSIYGAAGRAAHHAYVASKHAVLGMTRSVALEVATRGLRVNALCAGVTATASMREAERVVPDLVGALVAEHPMKRMATEDEMANAILWLSSPAAGFVTGAAIAADGGYLAA